MRKFWFILCKCWSSLGPMLRRAWPIVLTLGVLLGLAYTYCVDQTVSAVHSSASTYRSSMRADFDKEIEGVQKALGGLRGEVIAIKADVAEIRDKDASKALEEKIARLQARLQQASKILADDEATLARQ